MEKAALLIVTLLWQGHWFGDRAGTVTFRWAHRERARDAVISWEVGHGNISLGGGRVALRAQDRATDVNIVLPEVRVLTKLKFRYQVQSLDGREVLEQGEEPISLYPKELLAPWAKRLEPGRVVVWDEAGGLPRLFKSAGLACEHVTGGGGLQMIPAEIILVGQEQLGSTLWSQAELLAQANRGSCVVIFSQGAPEEIMGLPLVRRASSTGMEWNRRHALPGFLGKDVLGAMGGWRDLKALRLKMADSRAAIAYWPEAPQEPPAATLDTAVAVRQIGKGQVLCWQLPLGNWNEDPRSQLVLGGVLDYVLGARQVAEVASVDSAASVKDRGLLIGKEVRP